MLVYLYGADSYRRQRYLREQLVITYQKKYQEGSIGIFDLTEENDFTKFQEFSGAQGLFAKVSLAVVYHPEEGEKEFIAFLKSIAEVKSATVIVVADKKLTKEFAFLGAGKEFALLSGMEFLKFIKAEAKVREFTASDAQLKQIGEAYDGDTWGAMTEIERISSGGIIETAGEIPDFFPMVQSLRSNSAQSRLKSLFYALETIEPAAVFNMLATIVSGGDKIKMADYDVAIKSGKLEYDDALLDIVLAMRTD